MRWTGLFTVNIHTQTIMCIYAAGMKFVTLVCEQQSTYVQRDLVKRQYKKYNLIDIFFVLFRNEHLAYYLNVFYIQD